MKFHVLKEANLRFDGGAIFGHVPKTVWGNLVEADEHNRIACSCNGLLVQTDGYNILTDVGMGTKWTEKQVGLYAMQKRTWDDILAPFGITPARIDLIVLSHLHIDHAGALTKLDGESNAVPVFPNATVMVQRGEWEAAHNPDVRSRASYMNWDFDPIEKAGKLSLIEGNRGFYHGGEVIATGGHTKYHQVVKFSDGKRTVYFLADIFPSSAHLKPNWVMGYDLIPLEVMKARAELLPLLRQENTFCVLGHEAGNPLGRIRQVDGKDIFEPVANL